MGLYLAVDRSQSAVMGSFVVLCLLSVFVCCSVGINLQVNVHYDGKPAPQSMYIRGDMLGLNWNSGAQMDQTSSSTWTITLSYSSSDSSKVFSFKPLEGDSSWSVGSNFMVQLPVVSSYVDIYPWFWSRQGEYEVIGSLYSPQLNNTRDIIVYTPPSYNENTLKTISNVLIMHDGQNLFNDSTSFSGAWDCQDTINQLVVQGDMDEVLIVGVYNTPDRIDEYTYIYDPCYTKTILGDCVGGGGKGDLYLDFLIETVMPFIIDYGYRIETGRENLGIMGSSLGGLISCYGAWTRGSVWSKAGCMSSSFWWDKDNFNLDILKNYPPPERETFYVDSGNCCPEPFSDGNVQSKMVVNHMEELGFVMNETLFYYLDNGASHSEYYWGRRFHIPMEDLYPVSLSRSTPM